MEGMGKTVDFSFYKGRKVLVTGNTGFKGSWMSVVLLMLGAEVYGYALKPEEDGCLYNILDLGSKYRTQYKDIRDLESLNSYIKEIKPDIVVHMAAQPIVRESYKSPVYTYETNVMGTVNILESLRYADTIKSFVNETTDKVYQNNEWEWGYRENDRLDGYDPYSNSKSCSELVTASYARSFYRDSGMAVSCCRAGNVIGGGDFAKDRIIPDCVRAAIENRKITVRNRYSIRPYQFVLEPVVAYLQVAMMQYNDRSLQGTYNIGPDEADCLTTGELVDIFCSYWGDGLLWEEEVNGLVHGMHEAGFLKLDISKVKKTFGWKPCYNIKKALESTANWSKEYASGAAMLGYTSMQAEEYFHALEENTYEKIQFYRL